MTTDEQFCATVQAISPVQEIGISHVGQAVFVIEPDTQQAIVIQCLSRTGAGAWKLLVDSLGVHRRVTGSAGFDPRRKQWTVILRQVPRSALMAPVSASRRYWKWRKWAKAYLTLLEAKGTPNEAHGSVLFCLLDGPAELALEALNIEELCVVNGADRLFSCLDERFPDLETHDKVGESLDDVFRLKVGKGERSAACTGRCRELFEEAAREGIELPDVARGYLMLRGRTVEHGAKRCRGSSFHFSGQCGCGQGVCSRHG